MVFHTLTIIGSKTPRMFSLRVLCGAREGDRLRGLLLCWYGSETWDPECYVEPAWHVEIFGREVLRWRPRKKRGIDDLSFGKFHVFREDKGR